MYLEYGLRRVDCDRCGVRVEQVPRGHGKSPVTVFLACFLGRWARRLSWTEVAEVFKVVWHSVRRAVEQLVEYGLAQCSLAGVTAVGVDQICRGRGQKFATLVWQLDAGQRRLLAVTETRRGDALRAACKELGLDCCAGSRFVCSDMWRPYLRAIAECLPAALNILDSFHIVMNLNAARISRTTEASLLAEGATA